MAQRLGIQDESDSDVSNEVFHRVELIKLIESDEEEYWDLANGNPSEYEKIKMLPTEKYLSLIDFTMKKRNKTPQGDGRG